MKTTGIPKNEIYVNTTSYRFSHGKEPRGSGPGRSPSGKEGKAEALDRLFWVHGSTYAEAKRKAVAEAAARCCWTVRVQP